MLRNETKHKIRKSFQSLNGKTSEFGLAFYDRLFHTAPEARSLFPKDMHAQATKLVEMLEVVVDGLDGLADLVPKLQYLGAMHKTYGALPEHYDLVGEALLDTLADHVPLWDESDRAAWGTLFAIAAETMIDAANTSATKTA